MKRQRWQEIKEITADAIERDGEARGAFLDEACGADRALRVEVERLLREHEAGSALSVLDPVRSIAAPWRWQAAPTLTKAAGRPKSGRSSPALTPDLLQRSGERLAMVALAYAVLFFIVNLFNELMVHGGGELPYRQSDHWMSQSTMLVLIALSLAVWYLLRRGRIEGTAVISVGLWFEIVGCFGMALAIYSSGVPDDQRIVGVTWMCVWIVAYPFIVPSPPGKATIAAFAAAATGPLAIGLLVAAGAYEWPPARLLLTLFAPLFICALLASGGARIIYRLGTELREARQLGSYRLESLIGRGGMGEVWVAKHHMLARPAALKLIRPEMLWEGGAVDTVAGLFEREAQNTALLTSPHTIELYDFGTTSEGILYYAMELLDGLDLDSLVRRHGPLPPARAVHFLEQICESLAEAHENGLVHRDIKPANVFVCTQGLVHDFIKVLDFGLVQRQRKATTSAEQADGDVHIAGTPGYMAPETLAAGEATAQSDLYAVGQVARWLLSGETGTTAGSGESSRHPIPAALTRIVSQCLERRPAARPKSASELRQALRDLRFDEPWNQDLARVWWTRRAAAAEDPGPFDQSTAPL